jgi:hypothetical protein
MHGWHTVGFVGGLIGSKYLAADVARRAFGYTRPEGLTVWSLSLPQGAATLAAAQVIVNDRDGKVYYRAEWTVTRRR